LAHDVAVNSFEPAKPQHKKRAKNKFYIFKKKRCEEEHMQIQIYSHAHDRGEVAGSKSVIVQSCNPFGWCSTRAPHFKLSNRNPFNVLHLQSFWFWFWFQIWNLFWFRFYTH